MPRSSKFAVDYQGAQENLNPNGYSTEPSFYVPGSKAANTQSRRKTKTLSPLVPTVNTNQMMAGPSYAMGPVNYGLMSPQTPSNFFMQPNPNFNQSFKYYSPSLPSTQGKYPEIDPFYTPK